MRADEWNQLHRIVVEASLELFGSVGLPATYVGPVLHRATQWAEIISIIGLGGGLRGTLVLSVPSELLQRSHPTRSTEQADLVDWLSELANLALGRIKAHLLGHGVTIQLSTPVSLSAPAFRFERFASPPCVHCFDVEGVLFHVIFEAVDEEHQGLGAMKQDASIGHGEMVTF